jgi:hypothetical protein
MLEIVIIRRASGPKREEVRGGWRKSLQNLCSTPDAVINTKSRKMR